VFGNNDDDDYDDYDYDDDDDEVLCLFIVRATVGNALRAVSLALLESRYGTMAYESLDGI
jgi:hypothetical protein